jgi:hypothetical protein
VGAREGFIIKVDGVQLRSWQEVFGIMESVETHEERGVLNITLIRRISLEIPLNELRESGVKLEQLVGQRISILRTNHDYALKTSSQDDDTGSKVH